MAYAGMEVYFLAGGPGFRNAPESHVRGGFEKPVFFSENRFIRGFPLH
jgi:hypothetical protein